MSESRLSLESLLEAAGVRGVAFGPGWDEHPEAAARLEPLAGAAEEADAVAVVTAAGLDLALVGRTPKLALLLDRDQAAAWLATHHGWFMLAGAPEPFVVLAPGSTLASSAALPGTWERSVPVSVPSPTSPEQSLTRERSIARAQRLEIDELREELHDLRAWVAAEAERARASLSWRLGHRLVRLGRRLTFRRDEGTDALSRLAQRMRASVDR